MTSVTYMVWKKTGGLDLMLPVLWKIRETYPNTKITLLIAEINKHHLIRDGMFYIRFCEHHDIELLDFLDFLPNWLRPFKGILRRLTKRAPVDGKSDNPLFDFLLYQLTKFLKQQIDYSRITPIISADILFINDRWWDSLPQQIILLILHNNQKKYLVQHGPIVLRHPNPPLLTQNVNLFDSLDAHLFNTPMGVGVYRHLSRDPLVIPTQESKIPLSLLDSNHDGYISVDALAYVGFPSFDIEWFNEVNRVINKKLVLVGRPTNNRQNTYNCLLIMRDIVDIHQSWKTTKAEFFEIINTIKNHIMLPYNVYLIIKPHPKQNTYQLRKNLSMLGLTNYMIVEDSIVTLLDQTDIAVTFQTSGAYYPLVYGIPTIHLAPFTKKHGRHILFGTLEQDILYPIYQLDELPNICKKVMESILTKKAENDAEHMRKFYPDGAIQLIMEQIKPWLKS